MGQDTAIEWTDATWNPVRGCTKISSGCAHCYAETFAERFRGVPGHPYEQGFDLRLVPEKIREPLKWRRPRRIFVNSMSDLFHEKVSFAFIDHVFAVMALCPQHTFQALTKRPERMAEYLHARSWGDILSDARREFLASRAFVACREPLSMLGERVSHEDRLADAESDWIRQAFAENGGRRMPQSWPLPNVWLGTSVEDQAAADERIPHLLRCPAAVRFLSCEPLLGPIDFERRYGERRDSPSSYEFYWPLLGKLVTEGPTHGRRVFDSPGIHWVIVGGESGPKARPCNSSWIRGIVQQCKAANVPCFVKQLGANFHCTLEQWHQFRVQDSWQGLSEDSDVGRAHLCDRKGGDWSEWPDDLRVREFPEAAQNTNAAASAHSAG